MRTSLRHLQRILLLPVLLLALAAPLQAGGHGEIENRAKILSYLLRQQLSNHHYSNKEIDDDLSRAAFGLFLEQLDSQKRFLLQEDVEKLRRWSDRIDDEINQGRPELPAVAADLLPRRILDVEKMVGELLAEPFDFTAADFLETDPEKLAFSADRKELRERWRKTLKFQIASRYLNLLEVEGELPKAGEDHRPDPELLGRATEKVRKSYDDLFARVLRETEEDYYDRYFNAFTQAFDPHTNYLPPAKKEDFDINMRGSLEGIGATLREEGGFIKVVRIIPGSAASRQGQLQAEDLILEVAQKDEEPVDVTDMRLRDAVSLIRGKKGTEVRLLVKKPDGSRQVIPIVRDVVQIEATFVKGTMLPADGSEKRYGYVKIPSFYRDFERPGNSGGRNSTDDVREEVKRLREEGMDGLVLDLRNNGGGALTDAVKIAGLFIEKGPVVQVRDSFGRLETLSDRDSEVVFEGPLVVLVNKFSASASEILAGALQDYRRALIIGSSHTHGKGTVQAMLDLDRSIHGDNFEKYKPLGALKVTTQKFYRVSGESTQYRGVEPDIVLPDRFEYLETGEQYVDYSLPWDRVGATDFTPWPDGYGSLEALQEESRHRISRDEEFQTIDREAERMEEKSRQTRISLLLADLLRERRQEDGLAAGMDHGLVGTEGEDGEAAAEKSWTEDLAEDPYLREARQLLGDWLRLGSSALAESPPPSQRQQYGRSAN